MTQHVNVMVRQVSDTASEGTARQHTVLCDRPAAKGGKDRGAMGGELLLMGLGGCFMSNLLAAVQARQAAVSGLKVALDATLSDAPARFTAIKLTVSGQYTNRGEMEKLVTIAERGCIVANTIKNAVALSFEIT
jgi:putative redox protein